MTRLMYIYFSYKTCLNLSIAEWPRIDPNDESLNIEYRMRYSLTTESEIKSANDEAYEYVERFVYWMEAETEVKINTPVYELLIGTLYEIPHVHSNQIPIDYDQSADELEYVLTTRYISQKYALACRVDPDRKYIYFRGFTSVLMQDVWITTLHATINAASPMIEAGLYDELISSIIAFASDMREPVLCPMYYNNIIQLMDQPGKNVEPFIKTLEDKIQCKLSEYSATLKRTPYEQIDTDWNTILDRIHNLRRFSLALYIGDCLVS